MFGVYSAETLKKNNGFFGNGDSFLFTFGTTYNIRTFVGTGKDTYYAYCNDDGIGFGHRF